MALNAQITGTPLTNIRANDYRALQYVALVPNDTVCQATVATVPTGNVWAQVTIAAPSLGSVAAIKSFQTVIFSTTSDYRATMTYKTYMRAGSSGTTLNIAQNSQALEVGNYITVLNTYEVFEKPAIERGGTLYFDWDIPFRRILPVETALPTAVVLTDDVVSYQPSPSVSGLDADASGGVTYAWSSSNGSDSFSNAAIASPVITLQAASFRWLRLEYTMNSVTNLRVIAVWTVPKSHATVTAPGFVDEGGSVANITHDAELGWSCTLPAYSGISDVMPDTFLCVFSDNWYNGTKGAITSNIDFVGYLGQETTRTRGDERYGTISEAAFTCNSIGSRLADTPVSTLSITSTVSPSVWFDIEEPTPIRVAQLLLSELSTVGHLCSFSFNSDHTDFVGNGDVFSNTPDVLYEALFEILDTINALIQYKPDGRMDIVRNLVELDSTARDAATTVVQVLIDDILDLQVNFDPVKRVRQLIVSGGWFDTFFEDYTPRNAYVPPIVDNRGIDKPRQVNQILTTNSTELEAQTELAQRAANKYAALNLTTEVTLTLKDEWYFLIPDKGVWFTFGIAVTDTARGITYDANTRWQLISMSYSTNNREGRRTVNATFRVETSNTGAYIEVAAPEEFPSYDVQPITAPPYTGGDYDDWWDNKDPAPPEEPNPTDPDCENGGFRVRDSLGYDTTRAALNGERLKIAIRGNGGLQGAKSAVVRTVDFDGGYGSYTLSIVNTGSATLSSIVVGGGGNPNNCVIMTQPTVLANSGFNATIRIDLGEVRTVESFEFDGWFNDNRPLGSATGAFGLFKLVLYDADEVSIYDSGFKSLITNKSVWFDGTPPTGFTGLSVSGVRYASLIFSVGSSGVARNAEYRIDNIVVTCPEEVGVQGDAFYYSEDSTTWQAYGAGDGFLLNNMQPASIPPFNSNHTYVLLIASATAGSQLYDFESPYARSEAENWSIQTVTCFLGVP